MTDRGDTDTFGGIFWVRAMDGSWRNASAGEACIEITRLRAENIRLREALDEIAFAPPGACGPDLKGCIRIAREALAMKP
jgi:hypothetical protein